MNRSRVPGDAERPSSTPGGTTSADALGAPAPRPARSRRDGLLQLTRRLDWRFLLPDPVLHHVALLGDDDPQLVQALRWTSRSLSLLDLGWQFTSGQEPRFDVVVLRSPRLEDAKRAAVLVDTGGCLYWEIERNLKPHPWCAWSERLPFGGAARRAPCRPERLRTLLRAQGFRDVRVYWHRPDFQNAVEIVPLENQVLLDYVLEGPANQLRGRLKRWFGRVLRRAGLLQRLVPTVSVIACRHACEEAA